MVNVALQLSENTALIVIDVQMAWDDPAWGPRNNPNAEGVIGRLLTHWREKGRPVVIVQHHSLNPHSLLAPDKPGFALRRMVLPQPEEHHIIKHVNSAFIGTDLKDWLDQRSIKTVVVVGLTTVHCCSTTIRMAGNLGYEVYAVEDAMATFDARRDGQVIPARVMHDVELAALDGEFCTVARIGDLI